MIETKAVIDWLSTSGLTIALICITVYVVRKFSTIFIRRAVRRAIHANSYKSPNEEKKREETLISIIATAFRISLWSIGAMLVVQELGINIAPFIASLSIVGVALGFGAQSLVKDFVSGLFIILENQYRVDDVVSIAGVSGVVEALTLRETILRDLDGYVHHVPNGLVDVATNMTMEYANINLNIGVGYDSDIEKVEKIINDVGAALAKDADWKESILEEPVFVRVENFGASEVVVKVLGKVMPGKQWAVAGEFRERIKAAFDKNKIEIPFPQSVIHQAKK